MAYSLNSRHKINGSSIKDEQHQAKATGNGRLFFCRLIFFFTSPEPNSTKAPAMKVICSVNDLLLFSFGIHNGSKSLPVVFHAHYYKGSSG
jgi:hypothetical protein